MLKHMLAADATCDGKFITGVVSTGIYCLPSCRARKPKPENVVFYASPTAARAGGLRACLRCKPDDFHAGLTLDNHQAQEQQLEEALSNLELAEVRSVPALATHVGVGSSKLHNLFRVYLHFTPAEWLNRQRVALARELLLTMPHAAAQIAFEVGFESLSAFGAQFRRWSAMTPQAFRLLPSGHPFCLDLPPGYSVPATLRGLGRDVQQTTARVEGQTCTVALRLPSGTALLKLDVLPDRVRGELNHAPDNLTGKDALALHRTLLRLLGLQTHPARFEAQIAAAPHLSGLLTGQSGLRIPLVADPFDGLVWAVVGQQVSFKAACMFRRRLLERVSPVVAEGLYAPPTPQALCSLNIGEVQAAGLTRARAELLHRVASMVLCGQLNLETLANGTASRAERTLLAIPGIGPWTAQYVLLRVLGFQDAAPTGDSALRSELQHFFGLASRPSPRQAQQLLAPFAPYRSLATMHFWHRFTGRTRPAEQENP